MLEFKEDILELCWHVYEGEKHIGFLSWHCGGCSFTQLRRNNTCISTNNMIEIVNKMKEVEDSINA